MKTNLLIIFFIGFQIAYSNDIKFGKVTKAELEETQHPKEADASAAILYKKERVTYNYGADEGWAMLKEVHLRVKIYKKEGLDWATISAPLYISNGDEETVSGVKGYTFNLVDGKISEEKLKKDGIFIEEVNRYRRKASFTLPEVKVGSVIDLTYTVKSPLFWHMDDFWFQYAIPVNKVHLRLDIPQYFVFKRYTKGFYPIQLNQTRENRQINISYRAQDDTRSVAYSRHSGTLDFFENVYEVNATDLPSLVEEEYTNNIDNYRAAIKFELASTQFPNRPYKNYSLDWEDVAKSIYQYDSFGNELRKTNYYKDDIDALLTGVTEKEEKIQKIFAFVQSKMTWNEFYSVGAGDGVKKAYKEGSGNVGAINLMLTSMLRYAGMKANPILVSTKSNGIPLYPTSDGFNYVIAGVEVLNDVILLDATEKNAYPGILPERTLNWMGRLIREDGSSTQVQLIPKELSKEVHYVNALVLPDGSVEGKTRTQYTKQFALSFRDHMDDTDEESYLDEMENQLGEMEVDNYELKNKKAPTKPVVETCTFSKENQGEIIGNKMYISPMLFLGQKHNPFKMEKREYPVDFSFPRQKKYMVSITVPEGYQIESIPENTVVQLPGNAGKFSYRILTKGNQINVNATTELNTAFFPTEYYDALKEYYKNLVQKHSEKVVLSKI